MPKWSRPVLERLGTRSIICRADGRLQAQRRTAPGAGAPVRRRAYVPEDPALIAAVRMVDVQAELIGRTLEQCRTTGDLVDLAKVLLLLRSIEHAASRAMPPLWRRWEEDYQRGPPDGKKAAKTAATPARSLPGQASVSGKAFGGDSAQEDRGC
jgi:hypothetical protein